MRAILNEKMRAILNEKPFTLSVLILSSICLSPVSSATLNAAFASDNDRNVKSGDTIGRESGSDSSDGSIGGETSSDDRKGTESGPGAFIGSGSGDSQQEKAAGTVVTYYRAFKLKDTSKASGTSFYHKLLTFTF